MTPSIDKVWLSATILAGAFLVACGASTPAPNLVEGLVTVQPGPPEKLELGASTYIIAGESMRFELSLRGIVGGETVTAFGQPGTINGQPTIIAKSRTETVGFVRAIKDVRDEVTTHIDLRTGAPLKLHADIKFGEKEAEVGSDFGRGPFKIRYHRAGVGPRVYRQHMPDNQFAYDAHAALGAMRAWAAAPGARAFFYALAGKQVWYNVITVAGVEEIKTKLGHHQAIRIDGKAWRMTRHLAVDRRKKPRTFSLWISRDADRKPLLVTAATEYGTVKVELSHYQRPELHITAQ